MNRPAGFLARAAMAVEKLERGSGDLEGDLSAQARSGDGQHDFLIGVMGLRTLAPG